jgi:hypothetical protein
MFNEVMKNLWLARISSLSNKVGLYVVLPEVLLCMPKRWIKREVDQDPEFESLSDWVRTIRSLVQGRIHKLKNCVNNRPKTVFKDNSIHNYLEIMFPTGILIRCQALKCLDNNFKCR